MSEHDLAVRLAIQSPYSADQIELVIRAYALTPDQAEAAIRLSLVANLSLADAARALVE